MYWVAFTQHGHHKRDKGLTNDVMQTTEGIRGDARGPSWSRKRRVECLEEATKKKGE
jgi:hypothetical protein